MLEYFTKLLFLLGIKNKTIKKKIKTIDLSKSINIEDDINIKCNFTNKICIDSYYIYTMFIFMILLVEPILLTIDIINNKKYYILPLFCYTIIIPIQYVHSIIYFNIKKKSFYELYCQIHKKKNKKIYCLPNDIKLTIYIISVSGVSICFSIMNTLISYSYDFIFILKIVSWLYGRTILSLNIYTFYYIFCKHLKDLKYVKILLTHRSDISIADFCYKIIDIRTQLRVSIEKLQPIYVTTTLIGSFAIGNIVKYKILTLEIILSSIIFFIIQFIFILIIYNVSNQRQELLNYVKETEFISRYIIKKEDYSNDSNEIQNNVPIINNTSQLSTTPTPSPYITLNIMKNKPELSNSLNNIILNTTVKKKIIENIKKNTPRKIIYTPEPVEPNKNENQLTEQIKISQINNIEDTLNISSMSIDWLILNTILTEEWSNFSFLGINLNDGSIFRKATMITGGIVAVTNYIDESNFL